VTWYVQHLVWRLRKPSESHDGVQPDGLRKLGDAWSDSMQKPVDKASQLAAEHKRGKQKL